MLAILRAYLSDKEQLDGATGFPQLSLDSIKAKLGELESKTQVLTVQVATGEVGGLR
jgi:hypothetical protein